MKHTESSRTDKQAEMFGKLRSLNYEGSFESAAGWLDGMKSDSIKPKPKRRIEMLKEFFAVKKIRIAYAVIALAFFAAACNYPVTSSEPAGDVLTWNVTGAGPEAMKAIETLPWLDKGPTTVNIKNVNGADVTSFTYVVPEEEHQKAGQYLEDLRRIPGVSEVKAVALSRPVKRPAYSALLHELFRIDINASNLSDEELKNEISAQLAAAGISGAEVIIERNGEQRRVKLNLAEGSIPNNGGFDMTITDGDKVERIKQMRKDSGDPGKFEGKTDEEIRRLVREDFPDENLLDEEIQIIREGGKVKVKVVREREN